MQAANQFTPDQLIVAGRRAEAQGQPAYALQFYRYVADQFPASTEAYEARDALFRLTPAAADAAQQRPQAAPNPATGYAHPPSAHQATPPASFGEVRPTAQHDPAAAPTQRPRAAKDARRAEKARLASADADHTPPSMPARGYRIGRLVAAMLNTIGWLLLVTAITMVPLLVTALTVKAFPKALKETIAGNLIAFSGGAFGALLVGLFAIFAAQVARASFDTADATRALLDANAG